MRSRARQGADARGEALMSADLARAQASLVADLLAGPRPRGLRCARCRATGAVLRRKRQKREQTKERANAAITLDLDDTLWPFAPIGARVEQVLHEWLLQHCPGTAERFPIEAMRELRDRVFVERPDLAHDFSQLRKLSLIRAMELSGDDPIHADAAFETFYAERNRVEFYPDSLAALERLAARVPLAAISNGNADLARVGVSAHFVFQLGAREHGTPKPAPASSTPPAASSISHRATCCTSATTSRWTWSAPIAPACAVAGSIATVCAGRMPTVRPDLEFTTLAALADWLDLTHQQPELLSA